MRVLLTILSLCFILSCNKKQYPQHLVTRVKDTTITKIEYRDTIVRIPAKEIGFVKTLPGDCPDFDTTVKKGNTTVTVSKKGDQLKVDCKEDSLRLVIQGLHKQIASFTSIRNDVEVPVPDPQPYIPKWVWYAIGMLAAAAGWGNRKILGYLIVKIVKLIAGLWT